MKTFLISNLKDIFLVVYIINNKICTIINRTFSALTKTIFLHSNKPVSADFVL